MSDDKPPLLACRKEKNVSWLLILRNSPSGLKEAYNKSETNSGNHLL